MAPVNNLVPVFVGEPVATYHLTAAALVGIGIWCAESGRRDAAPSAPHRARP